MCRASAVPAGLAALSSAFPALTRWATKWRPSGWRCPAAEADAMASMIRGPEGPRLHRRAGHVRSDPSLRAAYKVCRCPTSAPSRCRSSRRLKESRFSPLSSVRRPLGFDLDYSSFRSCIVMATTPWPVCYLRAQTSLHGISMDEAKLVHERLVEYHRSFVESFRARRTEWSC